MTVVIARATLAALPRLNRAIALLMEEEGRIEIVGDETTNNTHGENS